MWEAIHPLPGREKLCRRSGGRAFYFSNFSDSLKENALLWGQESNRGRPGYIKSG
jgi:hypothetical protein